MKQTVRFGLVALLVLFFSMGGYAQRTKEALQKEIKSLKKEIETANQLLKETSKNKEVTLNQATILSQEVQKRQEQINIYKELIKVLDDDIKQGELNIGKLNGEIQKLREEYAKMVQFAYRNRNRYDQLEFLFASDDFNQALRRMRYIQQFADARKTKIDQIASAQKQVSDEVENNRKAREEQTLLLAEEKAQQDSLLKKQAELNVQIEKLKKDEKTIQQDIKNKQAQADKFQKQIDDIIAEEIRKANELAAKNKANTTNTDKMALTPTEKALATSFSSNKGKLPWPVERGVVSSSFGKHASVFSDKVTTTNNGINIATTENAKVRCVFDGVVVSVVKPSASNIGVIVRHGDYFTVYSQMDEVYVNRGDKVTTKQNIGKVHTDRSEGKTELHFELRKGTETLNPSQWLAK